MLNSQIHCLYDDLLDPSKLKDNAKNRNKHGQDQIERLVHLYKTHGVRHPIIISNQTKSIVSGHARKLAAIRAGIKDFPVVYQDFESPEQEYAFIQSDNAIALWAELDLSGINADLGDLGPDLDLLDLGIRGFQLNAFDLVDKVNKGDENSEWVGMPNFEAGDNYIKLIFHFKTEADRESYCDLNNIVPTMKKSNQWIVHK